MWISAPARSAEVQGEARAQRPWMGTAAPQPHPAAPVTQGARPARTTATTALAIIRQAKAPPSTTAASRRPKNGRGSRNHPPPGFHPEPDRDIGSAPTMFSTGTHARSSQAQTPYRAACPIMLIDGRAHRRTRKNAMPARGGKVPGASRFTVSFRRLNLPHMCRCATVALAIQAAKERMPGSAGDRTRLRDARRSCVSARPDVQTHIKLRTRCELHIKHMILMNLSRN